MVQTCLFNNDCKLWRRQPADVKTWTRFKEFFATAHQEWRESQTTTSGAVFQSGDHAYQSANHAYQNETVEAIANITTDTASDHASVAALTATNSTLTDNYTSTHSQLLISLQDLAKLLVTVVDLRKNSALQVSSPPAAPRITTAGHAALAETTPVKNVLLLRQATRIMLLATTKRW